jgi:hypothetical protein
MGNSVGNTRRSILKSFAAAGLNAGVGSALAQGKPSAQAEWLILYYMNGKNNLAKFALQDFAEMSKVGSNGAISLVAQLGRPLVGNPPIYDGWSGVKRYYIKQNMTPSGKEALMHVGDAKSPAGDMGNPATLDAFLTWAAANYPAKRKMLVIWNHGQGWRFQAAKSELRFQANSRAFSQEDMVKMPDARVVGTFRSVSSDDDHRSILYNKQVQNVLEAHAEKGMRFDIVSYDACLMSMVETAYSLRRCTDYLVGSQELEPGAGWNHTLILEKLIQQPTMSPEQLAAAMVKSYQEHYGDLDMTTLSATKLSAIEPASRAISEASRAIRTNAQETFHVLQKVRDGMKAFADYEDVGFAVDSETLFEELAKASANAAVKSRAAAAAQAIKGAVTANYASAMVKAYSPRGLALYFPRTNAEFKRDRDGAGYLRSNTQHPVDFVKDNEWSLVLRDLLKLPA